MQEERKMSFILEITSKQLVALSITILPLLISLPAALKAWIEAKHHKSSLKRAESEFAFKISDRLQDSSLARYSEELAYAALVGQRHLTHAQRVVLLRQTDSEHMIARYSRLRQLVKVDITWPHLRWKGDRYNWPWYRNSIIYISFALYFVFSFAGVLLLIMPEVAAISLMVDRTEMGLAIIYLLIMSSWLLVDALKLGLAADLIKTAAQQPPVQSPGTGSGGDFDVDEHD